MKDEEVSDYLSSLSPGKVPLNIFNEISRLTVIPVIEVVPFYYDVDGNLKVYLLKRPATDQFWPNKYHVPGSIISVQDKPGSFDDTVHRITSTKLSGFSYSKAVLVGSFLCKVERGNEVAIVFRVNLSKQPEDNLFSVDDVPEDLIEGQDMFIKAAANIS